MCNTGSLDGEVDDVLHARVQFLFTALCSSVLGTVFGIICYWLTNSLTVQLDFFSAGADGVAVLLNIIVEYAKARMTDQRYILSIDLLGGFISLMMLLTVVLFGLVHANERSAKPDSVEYSSIEHTGPMLAYNALTILTGGITMWMWWRLRKRMALQGTSRLDWINVVSGFLHSAMDLLGSVILTCTTCWLIYLSFTPENHWLRTMDMVRGDAIGSVLLCFVVVLSAIVLVLQSIRNAWELMYISEATDPEMLGHKADLEQKAPMRKENRIEYGAMAKAG